MHQLKYTGQEVEDILDKIPEEWTDIVAEFVKNTYDPTSSLAQSGIAISEAFTDFVTNFPTIPQADILALFTDKQK